ncbi:MAG: hypothetical protein P8Y18_08210 [Candidatus Bathyarchaeota archaeon]
MEGIYFLENLKYFQKVYGYMKTFGLCFLLVFISLISFPIVYCLTEIDTSVEVKSIIDGVTFVSTDNDYYKLADVCPRCTDWDNSTGFLSSKGVLSSIILGKTVYLDIDSRYVTDEFGTGDNIVCVAFVDYNSTYF